MGREADNIFQDVGFIYSRSRFDADICLKEQFKVMAKTQITRRQKNISRLLRERKQIYKDKLKTFKKKKPC